MAFENYLDASHACHVIVECQSC